MHGRGRRRRAGRGATVAGTLSAIRSGDEVVVGAIHDECARAQAIRFGIGEGAVVRCVTTLPGGPIILRSGRQEIAVGRGLAGRIEARAASEGGSHA